MGVFGGFEGEGLDGCDYFVGVEGVAGGVLACVLGETVRDKGLPVYDLVGFTVK